MNGERIYTIIFDDLDSDPGEILDLVKRLADMTGTLPCVQDALVVKTANPRFQAVLDALFPSLAVSGNGYHAEEDIRQERTEPEEWQPAEKPAKRQKSQSAAKKEYSPRQCAGCGEMFTPIRFDQVVASGHKSCRIKVSSEKQHEKKAASGNGSTVRSDLAEVFRHHSGPLKGHKVG